MKPLTKKIQRLVARHFREKTAGNRAYDKSAQALLKAREAGLQIDQPVEVTFFDKDGHLKTETFALRDNFTGEAAYRPARIPHFELKKVPKKPRSPKPGPEAAEIEAR